MSAVYASLVTASLLFLGGWIVMLVVAATLAFRSESLTPQDAKRPRRQAQSSTWTQN
jgi:hypothetical protein